MKTEIRTFDSSEIEKLLDKEDNYRKLSISHSDALLADMLAGRWMQPSPSPIVLSKDGNRLIDGQHRLLAALNYNKQTRRKVQFLVVYVKDEASAIVTMDTGKKRTIGDFLARCQATSRTTVGALIAVEAALPQDGTLNVSMWDRGASKSVAAMAEEFSANRSRMEDVASMCHKAFAVGSLGAPGLLAAVVWQIQKKNRAASERFVEMLGSGVGMTASNPIYQLRQYMQRRAVRGSTRVIERRSMVAALIIKAWNAWISGQEVKTLRWRTEGAKPEPFPQIEKGGLWSPFEKGAAA